MSETVDHTKEIASETRDVELVVSEKNDSVEASNTTVVDVVRNTVEKFIHDKFDDIKSVVLKKIEGLERQFPLLEIIKILIEMVERDGKSYELNGEKKQEVVVVICEKLGSELKESEIAELKLLGDILSNKDSVKQQVSTIFKIHNGELEINFNDGLEDELEIVATCCTGCLSPLLTYLSKRCKCIKTKKKTKKSNLKVTEL